MMLAGSLPNVSAIALKRVRLVIVLVVACIASTACAAADEAGEESPVPFKEDFTSCDHFSQDKDATISLGCVEGEYQMIIKDPRHTQEAGLTLHGAEFGALDVEADVELRAGPQSDAASFGVGCYRSRDPREGYRVGLTGGGRFVMWVEDQSGNHAGFHPEEVNAHAPGLGGRDHVRAVCSSSGSATVIELYVNGRHVGHGRDPDGFHPFTAISLWGETDRAGTDIRFDNVAVTEG
jgi:hypothetical protein